MTARKGQDTSSRALGTSAMAGCAASSGGQCRNRRDATLNSCAFLIYTVRQAARAWRDSRRCRGVLFAGKCCWGAGARLAWWQ